VGPSESWGKKGPPQVAPIPQLKGGGREVMDKDQTYLYKHGGKNSFQGEKKKGEVGKKRRLRGERMMSLMGGRWE